MHKVRCYLVKLKLIEMGDLANAESLQESYQFTSDFDLDGIGSSNVHSKMSFAESKTTKSQSQSDVEAQLSHYEDAYNRTILSRPLRLLPESDKAVQQAVIDEFIGKKIYCFLITIAYVFIVVDFSGCARGKKV